MPPPMGALLPSGVVMPYRHLLVVCAFRAGEVPGAAGRVGGDDGSLVVIVNVAALLALLAVGDHRTPLVYHYPARNLYCQRATSVRYTPACRFNSTASRAGTGVSCSPQAWLVLERTKPVFSLGDVRESGGRARSGRSRIRERGC